MEEITYTGWAGIGTDRCKRDITIVGEVIKETANQIVVHGDYKYYPRNEKTTFTINKSKIVSRGDSNA